MNAEEPGYPATGIEFDRRFATEEACLEYLFQLRWPDGFRCPRCEGMRSWPTGRRGLLECASCHHQTTVLAGTLFEGTRKPILLWFRAMWLISNQKNGVSALAVQRELGLKRYETAWTMLHKLRRAMVRPGRDRLSGTVEADETYVGGEEQGVRGRGAVKKTLVAVAVEEDGKAIGRIRLEPIPDASGPSLVGFVERNVEPGSLVRTDGWDPYERLPQRGYRHQPVNIKRSGLPAHDVLPHVHLVASLLKRWLLGTHQGAVRSIHLDYYLDEFAFRFNRRKSRKRGMLFYRLAQQATSVEPVTWATIADGDRGPQPVVAT